MEQGSKSSAMRAVGTVSAVYGSPPSRRPAPVGGVAGRHLPCHPLGRPAVTARTSSALAGGRAGARSQLGGRHDGESRGVRGLEPGVRPMGGRAGRGGQARTGIRMARRGAAPQALLQVDLLGRIEVRTARGAGRLRPAVTPQPSSPCWCSSAARGRARRSPPTSARPESDRGLGRLAPPGPLGSSGKASRTRDSPPDSVLDVSTEAIAVRADANIALDIVAFEACFDASLCGAERAIALYGGDLGILGHDCFAAESASVSPTATRTPS